MTNIKYKLERMGARDWKLVPQLNMAWCGMPAPFPGSSSVGGCRPIQLGVGGILPHLRLGIVITITVDSMLVLQGLVTLMAFEGYHCQNYENAIKECNSA